MVDNINYGFNPLGNTDPDILNSMLVEPPDSVDNGDASSVCDSVSNSIFDMDTNSVLESDITSPAVSETASNIDSVVGNVIGSVDNDSVVDNHSVDEDVYENDNNNVDSTDSFDDSTSGTKEQSGIQFHSDIVQMLQNHSPELRSQAKCRIMWGREKDAAERLADDSGDTHDFIMPLSGLPGSRRLRSLCRNRAHVKTLHRHRSRMARQIVGGVVFMHSRGIVHGQLSCENIFVDTEGNARIGNLFGCSIDGMSSHVVKHEDHHVLPRFPYVWSVTEEADIFALGSTLYELMALSPPYEGMSESLIKSRFAHGHFPSLDAMPILARLIQRCWTGQYQTAEDVFNDLEYYTNTGNSEWY